jgi:methionyl-tRNA synthetase
MPPKKNATPIKPLEGSSMLVAKSESLYFRMSKLEELVKGFVKKSDLDDFKAEFMK